MSKMRRIIKPDVVLYEESLDSQVLQESVRRYLRQRVMIIGGTSLSVYPAASLMDLFQRQPSGSDKQRSHTPGQYGAAGDRPAHRRSICTDTGVMKKL